MGKSTKTNVISPDNLKIIERLDLISFRDVERSNFWSTLHERLYSLFVIFAVMASIFFTYLEQRDSVDNYVKEEFLPESFSELIQLTLLVFHIAFFSAFVPDALGVIKSAVSEGKRCYDRKKIKKCPAINSANMEEPLLNGIKVKSISEQHFSMMPPKVAAGLRKAKTVLFMQIIGRIIYDYLLNPASQAALPALLILLVDSEMFPEKTNDWMHEGGHLKSLVICLLVAFSALNLKKLHTRLSESDVWVNVDNVTLEHIKDAAESRQRFDFDK